MNAMLAATSGLPAIAIGLGALRGGRLLARGWFVVGMLLLGAQSLLAAGLLRATEPGEPGLAAGLLIAYLAILATAPGVWLGFSLVYSRANADEFLRRWKWPLAAALIVPLAAVLIFGQRLFEIAPHAGDGVRAVFRPETRYFHVFVLLVCVLVLIHLEKTVRSSTGLDRWRIKFVVLGTALIFGTKIYVLSQQILFQAFDEKLVTLESAALLIASGLLIVGGVRRGFVNLEIYPSQKVLQGSITVVLVGGYLVVVGILAQVVGRLGGAASLPGQAFVILVGVALAAALSLSDRFRSATQGFISRHLRRPRHDYRSVWTRLMEQPPGLSGSAESCRAAAELIAEEFHVLSVNFYLLDESRRHFEPVVSTFQGAVSDPVEDGKIAATPGLVEALETRAEPFDLEPIDEDWAATLRESVPSRFRHGRHRFATGLAAGEKLLGVLLLADRVNGIPYTQEELDLLSCITHHTSACLSNQRLTQGLLRAREMEAFQTMSTFFVHDLKNAASSLNLILENFRRHHDDPEFRGDALRGMARISERIASMIGQLSALRRSLEPRKEPCECNEIVESVLGDLRLPRPGIRLVRELAPLPPIDADRQRIHSVISNLLANAVEAIEGDGTIKVETRSSDGAIVLAVEDDGCGMSPEFIRDGLFHPFRSTKNRGLGLGMYQCRSIVEAHDGRIEVDSEPGRGTRFEIVLPAARPAPGD